MELCKDDIHLCHICFEHKSEGKRPRLNESGGVGQRSSSRTLAEPVLTSTLGEKGVKGENLQLP